jgi:ArsR family metal-binding transcriptional regulator
MEAHALLQVDLTDVLPYLNAEVTGARYTPSIPALIWMHKDHQVGILQDRIAIDHIHEHDDVESVIEEIVSIINHIWSNREHIIPRHTARAFRQPLELYSLLPRTNCKICGEETCYSFALKLTAGLSDLSGCPPLFEQESDQDKLTALEQLLAEKDPTQ